MVFVNIDDQLSQIHHIFVFAKTPLLISAAEVCVEYVQLWCLSLVTHKASQGHAFLVILQENSNKKQSQLLNWEVYWIDMNNTYNTFLHWPIKRVLEAMTAEVHCTVYRYHTPTWIHDTIQLHGYRTGHLVEIRGGHRRFKLPGKSLDGRLDSPVPSIDVYHTYVKNEIAMNGV